MIIASIVISVVYGLLILWLIVGFDKVKLFDKKAEIPKTKFSVIIPFRNEENNLTELLNSLALINYPKDNFEILMVNDDSNDGSVQIIEHFKTRHLGSPINILNNLRKSISPKKDAIETAIAKAQFDWILTTDADCIVPKNWLQTFDAFIQAHHPKLIVAPVNYTIGNSFLDQFQLFDFLSLQATTIGGFGINRPFLCNGANLCYEKSVFAEVNGFKGNKHIASGDDIFLLEKVKERYPKKVRFLKSKEVVVVTKPRPTCPTLISQRVRWAAKTSSVKNGFTKFVGTVVLLMNFSVILAFVLFLFTFITWQFLLFFFGVKLIIDLILIIKSFRFFKQPFNLSKYLINSLCYPFFSMFVVMLSFNKGYYWKNRAFKK